jgi:TRAP-type C4-dicarboxylate transport system substrate-binding protein
VFDRLSEPQKKALTEAARKAEAYFNTEARNGDRKMVEVFKGAGVQVAEMSAADYQAWLAVARKSAYANFASKVPGGEELIRKALSVD